MYAVHTFQNLSIKALSHNILICVKFNKHLIPGYGDWGVTLFSCHVCNHLSFFTATFVSIEKVFFFFKL